MLSGDGRCWWTSVLPADVDACSCCHKRCKRSWESHWADEQPERNGIIILWCWTFRLKVVYKQLAASSRTPRSYNGDDPMAFAGWKFAFCSRLSFGDPSLSKMFLTIWKSLQLVTQYQPTQMWKLNLAWSFLPSWRATWKGDALAWSKAWPSRRMDSSFGERWFRSLSHHRGRDPLQLLSLWATIQRLPTPRRSWSRSLPTSSWFSSLRRFLQACIPQSWRLLLWWNAVDKSCVSTFSSPMESRQHMPSWKETMLGYDKACRAWTPEAVLKSAQSYFIWRFWWTTTYGSWQSREQRQGQEQRKDEGQGQELVELWFFYRINMPSWISGQPNANRGINAQMYRAAQIFICTQITACGDPNPY